MIREWLHPSKTGTHNIACYDCDELVYWGSLRYKHILNNIFNKWYCSIKRHFWYKFSTKPDVKWGAVGCPSGIVIVKIAY